MSTFSRYLLFQIPGWMLLAGLLYLLRYWDWISTGVAGVILSLGILKDFILFPWFRKAYEPGGHSGAKNLVGARGVVQNPLNPSGWIRINGELWQAVTEGDSIPSGTPVRVVSVNGLSLRVTRITRTVD